MMATVINYMDRLAMNQMAFRIKTYFGMTNTEYSFLESAFSFAFGVGAFCTGLVVDRISVRWVYPLMVLGWSIAGILTGFANGFWTLLSCRFALGFFESGNWPCGIRTTRAVLRPEERSFGNAIFQSGTAFGAVVTPLLVLALLRSLDPLEPQRHALMAVTGGTYAAVSGAPPATWKYPFRVIGSLGVVWIVLWFATVPRVILHSPRGTDSGPKSERTRFRDVLCDPRLWVLLTTVIAINITWHGYRAWLPLYLQEQRGFNEAEMSRFTTLYYLAADIGVWTAGGCTLLLCRGGIGVHRSRIISYGCCAMLTMTTVAVPFLPQGAPLAIALLVIAFGALGLFPTYFALSQELAIRHQGKVSGTLGAAAHFSLTLIYPLEGLINDATRSYELVLGGIGLMPMIAFLFLLWKWPAGKNCRGDPA